MSITYKTTLAKEVTRTIQVFDQIEGVRNANDEDLREAGYISKSEMDAVLEAQIKKYNYQMQVFDKREEEATQRGLERAARYLDEMINKSGGNAFSNRSLIIFAEEIRKGAKL